MIMFFPSGTPYYIQPALTITMNKMRKNQTQLMNEQKMDI